ncbi:hypothetical protein [Treponema sp. J25]|uniref:hypothetical protein n=1 Tax=Treponema sp. J25 TaxID=2094121 RepID=UPI0010499DAB|nr:hypothetical protein [Treponema sp. J25]TCW60174.1 hypothetical protein C5O22_12825 [Treponema sp. J25]
MKYTLQLGLLTGLGIAIVLSCQHIPAEQNTVQEPVQNSTEAVVSPSPPSTSAPPEVKEEPFDPRTVTKEEYDTTKIEVQQLIERLNYIIRNKDFNSWVSYLSPVYRDSLSDPDFLAQVSESARLKNEKIVLRTLQDYFIYVVVPSRANDRVDDIEFIGQKRVKAYTVTPKGQRLRLYDLEKRDGQWKIIN